MEYFYIKFDSFNNVCHKTSPGDRCWLLINALVPDVH